MNVPRIEITPAAETDLLEQALHFASVDPQLPFRFAESVRQTLALLQANPELGHFHNSVHHSLRGLRCWPIHRFPHHLLFYEHRDDAMLVVRILHGARELRDEL